MRSRTSKTMLVGRKLMLRTHVLANSRRCIPRTMSTASSATTRTESDAFGPLEVENTRLWGAQTQRSIMNFPIGGPESKMPLQVIRGFGVLKKCAAKYNMEHGKLDSEVAQAMMAACDEVIQGKLDDHFPLVIFQTGSGTQSVRGRPRTIHVI